MFRDFKKIWMNLNDWYDIIFLMEAVNENFVREYET